MSTHPRSIVDQNRKKLDVFVRYASDSGNQRLSDVVAKERGFTEDSARELVDTALVCVTAGADRVSTDSVIAGAPSLALLVRFARKLNPSIFATGIIPGDNVVDAALALFYKQA